MKLNRDRYFAYRCLMPFREATDAAEATGC